MKVFRHIIAAILVLVLAIFVLCRADFIVCPTSVIKEIPPTKTTLEPVAKSAEGDVVTTREKWEPSDKDDLRPIEKVVVREKKADPPAPDSSIQTTTSYSVRVWALWLQSVTLLVLVGGVLWAVVALCRID
jgi:hypothetical protein